MRTGHGPEATLIKHFKSHAEFTAVKTDATQISLCGSTLKLLHSLSQINYFLKFLFDLLFNFDLSELWNNVLCIKIIQAFGVGD